MLKRILYFIKYNILRSKDRSIEIKVDANLFDLNITNRFVAVYPKGQSKFFKKNDYQDIRISSLNGKEIE